MRDIAQSYGCESSVYTAITPRFMGANSRDGALYYVCVLGRTLCGTIFGKICTVRFLLSE